APLTTINVGGPADWLIDVRTVTELTDLLEAAGKSQVPVTVLGGGSNVLIGDRGIRGAVLRLRLWAVNQPSPDRGRAESGSPDHGPGRWTIQLGPARQERSWGRSLAMLTTPAAISGI